MPLLVRAKTLFPDYAGPDSAYSLLAQVYKARGNMRAAANELTALTSRTEDDSAAHVELAGKLEQ